jgi:FkbM family methyltransferase
MAATSHLALHIDARFRRLRARVWPRSYAKRRLLLDHLRGLFIQRQIDCVFDVGANRGQYYRFLRYELGFRGLIVSCEPIASLAAELARLAAIDPLWKIVPCALGAAPGNATLNVMQSTVYSSLLQPDDSATDVGSGENVVARQETITVRTLKDVYSELLAGGATKRIYLKLDTQGYDLEVLRGAGAALESVVALQTEVSFVPIYKGMVPWQQMLAEIGSRGFDLSGLFPVTLDAEQRLIEADAVCVRR